MKTKIIFLLIFFSMGQLQGFSQMGNKKRKDFRAERKLELKRKTGELIESKNFVFTALKAFPMGGSAVDLTTNSNYLKFTPDMIESYMPFFGQAYSIDYPGTEGGIKFKGKPEEFQTKALKGNKGYDITVRVPYKTDNFNIRIQVGPEGGSTVTILSANRSSISYLGNITEPEKSTQ